MFLHGRPVRTANGFPDPQMVSRHPSMLLVKGANSAFLRAPMVTVPWLCIGYATGERVVSNAESSETLAEMKVPTFAFAQFPVIIVHRKWFPRSANGFPGCMEICRKQATCNSAMRELLRFLPCGSAWTAMRTANAFPDPHMVSRNPSQTNGKQVK